MNWGKSLKYEIEKITIKIQSIENGILKTVLSKLSDNENEIKQLKVTFQY